MELLDAAKALVKFGAILGMVLGLISVFYWAYFIVIGASSPFFTLNFYEVLLFILSLIAIGLSYYVLTRVPQRLEVDPWQSAFYLIGMGILIAIGAWGIAGLLIVLGAVFILMEETK
ncbi:MAG: hypothetical protein ACXADB_09335 [Candidatus Hermodarchaeia archaeon]|jgi:uncharacterized membrane protein